MLDRRDKDRVTNKREAIVVGGVGMGLQLFKALTNSKDLVMLRGRSARVSQPRGVGVRAGCLCWL